MKNEFSISRKKNTVLKHRLGQILQFTAITTLLCAAPIHQALAKHRCVPRGSIGVELPAIYWVEKHGYQAPVSLTEHYAGEAIPVIFQNA